MKYDPANDLTSLSNLIRLNRPIGWVLLVLPALWSVVIIEEGVRILPLMLQLTLGSFCMRSAGCIVNDIADRDLDALVERTKARPLASKRVSLQFSLMILACFLLASSLIAFTLPNKVWYLVLPALLLIGVYPLIKRVSHFPQIVLGTAFGLAVPFAYLASGHTIDRSCGIITMITILWVVLYDTQYAVCDLQDDMRVGIKSMAVLFKNSLLSMFLIVEILIIFGWILLFLMIPIAMTGKIAILITLLLFFCYQNALIATEYPKLAMRVFYSHGIMGFIILLLLSLFVL